MFACIIQIVRHEFTTVLMSLVDTFGDKLGFSELKGLRNEDIETDFFENINHIQVTIISFSNKFCGVLLYGHVH